jgi:release factor glutamine methyltransferase
LAVGPGVFVPRPETEHLVDLVVPVLRPDAVVVDLCAGSGAIGLAIASEHPGTDVHLVESEPAAAHWLRRNRAALDATATTPVIHEQPLDDPLGGLEVADVVVSNPPYLPTSAGDLLTPEVADFDPPRALWGGTDGLDVVRDVVRVAASLLRPGGLLAVEHDARHQPEVIALFHASGFADVRGHLDLTTRPRFVTGSLQ